MLDTEWPSLGVRCDAACWDATGSMLQGWGTLLGVIAVIYAARKAADTFKSFRRQKQEEGRIDVAQRVLTISYKARRAIREVRVPFHSAWELEQATEELKRQGHELNPTEGDLSKNLASAQVVLTRIADRRTTWEAVAEILPLAKAVFGDEVETYLESLLGTINQVRGGALGYARQDGTSIGRYESLIYEGMGDKADGNDTLSKEVDDNIATLEKAMLPVIRADLES